MNLKYKVTKNEFDVQYNVRKYFEDLGYLVQCEFVIYYYGHKKRVDVAVFNPNDLTKPILFVETKRPLSPNCKSSSVEEAKKNWLNTKQGKFYKWLTLETGIISMYVRDYNFNELFVNYPSILDKEKG